jgi:hypothetical protein
MVCATAVAAAKTVPFQDTRYCDNDKASSVLVHDLHAGQVLTLYDLPGDAAVQRQDEASTAYNAKLASRQSRTCWPGTGGCTTRQTLAEPARRL